MSSRWGRRIGPLAVLLALPATGCVDSFLAPEPGDGPVEVFDQLWTEFDRHYAFFETAGVDWDGLRAEYRPRVTPSATGRELFGILSEMLDRLRDGHVNLWTPHGTYDYDAWYRGHSENFDPTLARARLREPLRWTHGRHIGYGRVNDDVGYVRIPSFGGTGWGDDIDGALDTLDGVRALVVDIRSNGGGTDLTTEKIMGRFADRKRIYRHYRYRNGPAHDDFTELIADRIEPAGRRFRGPVAVLTNRRNFSAAEDFVLGMRLLDHVVTVGDSTGGGMGNPIHRELSNGWTFRLSRWQVYTADRRPLPNGVGLAPDVPASISAADAEKGRDTILETALEILNGRLAEGG